MARVIALRLLPKTGSYKRSNSPRRCWLSSSSRLSRFDSGSSISRAALLFRAEIGVLIVRGQLLGANGRLDALGQGERFSSTVVVEEHHPRVFPSHVLVNCDDVDVCPTESF